MISRPVQKNRNLAGRLGVEPRSQAIAAHSGRIRSQATPPNTKAHGQRNKHAANVNRKSRNQRPGSSSPYPVTPPMGPLAYLALHVASTRRGL